MEEWNSVCKLIIKWKKLDEEGKAYVNSLENILNQMTVSSTRNVLCLFPDALDKLKLKQYEEIEKLRQALKSMNKDYGEVCSQFIDTVNNAWTYGKSSDRNVAGFCQLDLLKMYEIVKAWMYSSFLKRIEILRSFEYSEIVMKLRNLEFEYPSEYWSLKERVTLYCNIQA